MSLWKQNPIRILAVICTAGMPAQSQADTPVKDTYSTNTNISLTQCSDDSLQFYWICTYCQEASHLTWIP